MSLSKKSINFDLDTFALKIHYPGKDWHNAYKDIKRFMLNNGFEHRQGSGYLSIAPMSFMNIEAKIHELYLNNEWMIECVKRLDVTSVGRTFDLADKMRPDKSVVSKYSLNALAAKEKEVQERVAEKSARKKEEER